MERGYLKQKISILVHGYNKNKNDMSCLSKNLEKLDHKCILVDLPLTYKEIDYATSIFDRTIEEILKDIDQNEKVNLIGHSIGGLVIRKYLQEAKNRDRIKNVLKKKSDPIVINSIFSFF